ncbi:hypothetical protein [uncultured Desulfovibrio sp.]|uniref:hypothetical protein n=1 Tax=uncultured Desulfovibrio sp. TaxID=167968 RepID=UPI00266BB0F6|nr:hypothetical protein [uncultured Desulfovibrio sp.]
MGRTVAVIVIAALLSAAVAWLVWQGQRQAGQLAKLEENAQANARAVQEQQAWAGQVDAALKDWRAQRDAQAEKTAQLRKQLEAARHDQTYASWADAPMPDAALRLLHNGAAAH